MVYLLGAFVLAPLVSCAAYLLARWILRVQPTLSRVLGGLGVLAAVFGLPRLLELFGGGDTPVQVMLLGAVTACMLLGAALCPKAVCSPYGGRLLLLFSALFWVLLPTGSFFWMGQEEWLYSLGLMAAMLLAPLSIIALTFTPIFVRGVEEVVGKIRQ